MQSPQGLLYAIENHNGEFSVARYAKVTPIVKVGQEATERFEPVWTNISFDEYIEILTDNVEFESAEQEVGSGITFYDLESQQIAEQVDDYLEALRELYEMGTDAGYGIL